MLFYHNLKTHQNPIWEEKFRDTKDQSQKTKATQEKSNTQRKGSYPLFRQIQPVVRKEV